MVNLSVGEVWILPDPVNRREMSTPLIPDLLLYKMENILSVLI